MKIKLETIPLNGDAGPAGVKADPAAQLDRSTHIVRRLRRAFRSISRCGDVMFSPYRLTTEQYSLMRAVQRDPGIRQVDLKDRIFAEPNTLTAMVTVLEKRGILRRKPSPSDGRARLLYLTTHGQAVLQRLSEDWEPMRAVLRKCFAGKAGQETLEILDQVYFEMEHARENLLRTACATQVLQADEDEMPDGAAVDLGEAEAVPERLSASRAAAKRARKTKP